MKDKVTRLNSTFASAVFSALPYFKCHHARNRICEKNNYILYLQKENSNSSDDFVSPCENFYFLQWKVVLFFVPISETKIYIYLVQRYDTYFSLEFGNKKCFDI